MIIFYYLITSFLAWLPHGDDQNKITIPIGGNAWTNGSGAITESGLVNWSDPETRCTVYFRLNKAGTLQLSLLMNAQGNTNNLNVIVGDESRVVRVHGTEEQEYFIGEYKIRKTGYVSVQIQGLEKPLGSYGNLSALVVSGSAVTEDMNFVKNNEGQFFYWGRRGPSVHIRYPLPDTTQVEYFYNEITVPAGNDVIGSYFMTNGFGEGYCGIQVNSDNERRVLFSVWSPFHTDDPSQIPEDQKIVLVGKGQDTHTGEFGNEGSGGQSYLRYFWKAGLTYRLLLRAKPADESHTTYTAWFYTPEENRWILIASWRRPKLATHLTHLHSFLENFEPETGLKSRMGLFGNQWARTADGRWIPLCEAFFTGDNTAVKGYRKDYAGGVSGESFFLKNGGFFDEYTNLRKTFSVLRTTTPPVIDFSKLPTH